MASATHPPIAQTDIRENLFLRSIVFIVRELVWDVVAFPVWWYGPGLWRALRAIGEELKRWSERLSLVILVRTMFKPMYGDYTRSGRIISFFMRILVFAFRLAVMLVWIGVLVAFLVLYLLAPVAAVYLAVLNFTAG